MKSENLSEKELLTKKSYVEICSINTQTSNFKFSELATLLNIKVDDIEIWAIEAI